MSSLPNRDEKHLQELMAGKVLGDLSNDELREFGELFSTINAKDLQELELAAAAVQLALADPVESQSVMDATDSAPAGLPDFLRQKIAGEALRFVVPASDRAPGNSPHEETRHVANAERKEPARPVQPSQPAWREVVAWLAVAASLCVAATLWFNGLKEERTTRVASAVESRLALLNDTQKVIRADWASGKTPFAKAVTGDVVWNNESQQGFMRFVGMPPNDPTQEQYQLWIIDPERSTEPIDGGVFDIASTDEVVVPIQAKLKVQKPAAFAITIEKPGGVVVSSQARLPLLAQVSK
ncbi:MAG: anti-sigma factor [Pirellulaceae bacterium]|nr:anti-sigma factor [Pirellulaceae bacterium]